MFIFRHYIKALTIFALLGGGLSGCTVTRAYDFGAYNQVNQLQQVGCLPRHGKND